MEIIYNNAHRGGWERTNAGYDFTGHTLTGRTIHHDPTAGDMTERYTYSYDAWGRPLTVTHRLENLSPVVLHSYAYDAVGRLERDSRVGGAEMARSEMFKEGRTPLHTFRADIDYALAIANTKVGCLGIKVWICNGEKYGKQDLSPNAANPSSHGPVRGICLPNP